MGLMPFGRDFCSTKRRLIGRAAFLVFEADILWWAPDRLTERYHTVQGFSSQ